MAVTDPRQRERVPLLTARQVRDLLAVVLIVAGLAGVVTVTFIASPLAGWGVVAVLALALGIYLGSDR